jgi:hypothetical protein
LAIVSWTRSSASVGRACSAAPRSTAGRGAAAPRLEACSNRGRGRHVRTGRVGRPHRIEDERAPPGRRAVATARARPLESAPSHRRRLDDPALLAQPSHGAAAARVRGRRRCTRVDAPRWPWLARSRRPPWQPRAARSGCAGTATASRAPASRSHRHGAARHRQADDGATTPEVGRDLRRAAPGRDHAAVTGRPARPDPARLAGLLVRTWLEVRAGRRPLEQLAPLVTPAVLRRLSCQLPRRPQPSAPIPEIRSVRASYPSPNACEASITLAGVSQRITALAVRLERNRDAGGSSSSWHQKPGSPR